MASGMVLWTVLLAGLQAEAVVEPAETSFPRRDVPDFNVMLNDDGDYTFVSPDAETSVRWLRAAVDAMKNTGVRTHVRCVGAGSDVLYYSTRVASVVGWREAPRAPSQLAWAGAGIAAGLDPLRIIGQRCKELGLHFIPSVRMNDAHFARDPQNSPLTGKLWLDNYPRLMLKGNRFDFTHSEVRAYRLAIIREVLDRYQDLIDGIELDFNRHALFFPPGEAGARADLLTELVSQVRRRLADIEQAHGRPYYLVVRVSPTLANCRYAGMNVDDWMRRRLVDVVVPAQIYSLAHDMPLGDFLKLAKETGVKIYPAVYPRTQYTWPLVREPAERDYCADPSSVPSGELIAGAASNYWAMGVDGFETFNYRAPPGRIGLETTRLLSHPATLSAHDRVYTITPAHGSDLRRGPEDGDDVSQYLKPLPTELPADRSLSLRLLVADDLDGPGKVRPEHAALRLGLIGVAPRTPIRLRLNGELLHDGPAADRLTRVTGGPRSLPAVFPPLPEFFFQVALGGAGMLRARENLVEIAVGDSDQPAPPRLVELQLGVFYDDPYPNRL